MRQRLSERPSKVSKETHRDRNIDVRKGQVYWFNINTAIDKFNTPVIVMGNVKYHDTIEYGYRPWLVVSDDGKNRQGGNVTIVPIHEDKCVDRDPTHVCIRYNGKDCVVLCDQPMSVAAGRLDPEKLRKEISEEDLRRCDVALAYHIGIYKVPNYLTNCDINQLEDFVNRIINNEVNKEVKRFRSIFDKVFSKAMLSEGYTEESESKESEEDLKEVQEDKVEYREKEVFENKINIDESVLSAVGVYPVDESDDKNKSNSSRGNESEGRVTKKKKVIIVNNTEISKKGSTKSQVQPPNDKVKVKGRKAPEIKETPKKTRKLKPSTNIKPKVEVNKSEDKQRRKPTEWDLDKAVEFLSDCEDMHMKEVASKWGYSEVSGAYRMKKALKQKFDL